MATAQIGPTSVPENYSSERLTPGGLLAMPDFRFGVYLTHMGAHCVHAETEFIGHVMVSQAVRHLRQHPVLAWTEPVERKSLLPGRAEGVGPIFMILHAETTSEYIATGRHPDGRVSALPASPWQASSG